MDREEKSLYPDRIATEGVISRWSGARSCSIGALRRDVGVKVEIDIGMVVGVVVGADYDPAAMSGVEDSVGFGFGFRLR